MHFGFALYEVSELEQTIDSLALRVLPWPMFANQEAQHLRDVHIRSRCHANPTVPFAHFGGALKFSSFSPANFTNYHFAYYLVLEKNKGALERKMNH